MKIAVTFKRCLAGRRLRLLMFFIYRILLGLGLSEDDFFLDCLR